MTTRAYPTFHTAAEEFAALGVDVSRALETLASISLSMHCWQGDDVTGFEHRGGGLTGGIAVTGNYPGRARHPDELRADLIKALSLIPGKHRVNLHASYGEFGRRKVDRDEVAPDHFRNWISWARSHRLGLDFNPTFFSHPKSADGFTLAHPAKSIRKFWIEHGRRSREIGAAFGKATGKTCITNFWIPDGFKDTPADRLSPRQRLAESLDAIFKKALPPGHNLDAVEAKLFGIGSESYVVGSHEFYLGYAITRQKLLCLDAGHFHPTETIADKLSSVLLYLPAVLLHLSRGVRWDSDHVVTFSDDLLATTREIVATRALSRTHIGLDYFDASINRVAAWVIGMRNVLRALLVALLEPPAIREAELADDFTRRLALQEEAKSLPHQAVWRQFCEMNDVPQDHRWVGEIKRYERGLLSARA